jgi:uncharacterized protein (TIGR02266 family)
VSVKRTGLPDDEAFVQQTDRERASQAGSGDPGDPADWVREFIPLNRRKQEGEPLSAAELARWEELRDLLEDCQGAVPPPPGVRRRRSIRVRTHLRVLVTTQLAQELLLVHDLSENGLFLRTQRPCPPGAPLQIEFYDKRGRSVELEATVVWVRKEGEGYGPAGMGVAFHAMSEWDRTVLIDLVEAALEAL